MGKTEACCDCAAIHDDVLEHVQEHIVPEDQRQSMAKLFKIFGDNTPKILKSLAILCL